MSSYTTRSRTDLFRKNRSQNPVLFEYPPEKCDAEPWRSVITFTNHDRKQLQSPKFLNDTIITFFMQFFLDTKVLPDLKRRIHVFDSFFFQKIQQSIKGKNDETKIAFDRASRWLRGVRIFDKDFLILPVCEKDHWLLIIFCYPANTPNRCSHKIPDDDLHEPAVIVLNSCLGLAPAIKKTLSQFLQYQWLIERDSKRSFTINNAKANGIRLILPDLPQQKNSYDCGVYVLNYFYCFLESPREAYIRMFRKQSMKTWFQENKVDTSWARRRMVSVVKEQTMSWESSGKKDLRQQSQNQYEQLEINIESDSQSDASPIKCLEDCETINGNSVIVIH